MIKLKSILLNNKTKLILRIFLALIPITLAIFFVKHEGKELSQSFYLIIRCNPFWLLAGLVVTGLFLFTLGAMYSMALKTVGAKVTFSSAWLLIMKRNFISVFLPGGGLTAMAFFTSPIENQGISKTRIHLASSIYVISSVCSLVIISIPAIIILIVSHNLSTPVLITFIFLLTIITALAFLSKSFFREGRLFRMANRAFPKSVLLFEELKDQHISLKNFAKCVLISFCVELCGIIHLFIAMKALGVGSSIEIVLLGYVVATLMLAISPFMRGLGAVEILLTLVLVGFKIPYVSALSITLLYRVFEFWLLLFTGALCFFYKRDNLVLRIFPAFLVFILGLVNILSVITPAFTQRIIFIENLVRADVIYLYNFTVIIAGIILLILSAFLMRGSKNAWRITLFIIFISVIVHLTKSIDYIEVAFGILVGALLIYTRKSYQVLSDKRLVRSTKIYLLGALAFIFIYGVVGFYFIDERHFYMVFNLKQSVYFLIKTAFFFNNGLLNAHTDFAKWFTISLNMLGASYIITLLFVFLKPSTYKKEITIGELNKAKEIVEKFGNSTMDYFKVYSDKLFYFGETGSWFVSYKTAGDFAIVLETPVCEDFNKIPLYIREFDKHCAENGLKTIYYRIDEKDLGIFERLNKKALFIGQEGIINVQEFSLSGEAFKSARNIIHHMEKSGFKCHIIEPPITDSLVHKLKAVSDDWLSFIEKKENAFSGGVFNSYDIKNQIIIIVEDIEEKVVGFANIIPDYSQNEGTYDLVRKTSGAPYGVMDILIVNMIEYFKAQGKMCLNVGLAPLSGIQQTKNFPESTLKFVYENLKHMQHYKRLRFFKDKYTSQWTNKFLIYSNDYDLIQVPFVINRVSRYEA